MPEAAFESLTEDEDPFKEILDMVRGRGQDAGDEEKNETETEKKIEDQTKITEESLLDIDQ